MIDVAPTQPTPGIAAPPGWTLGTEVADGGTALVYAIERPGSPPALIKMARWRDREGQARCELEAEVLRTVGPPATPAYLEHGTLDRWPYLIMERLAGETLASWMSRAGERGGLGEIVAILTHLAKALDAIHAHGFIHRDLKPENVMIGPTGVRVLDFGLARPLRAPALGLTQIGSVVGTSHYIAPEQIRTGGTVDHRADIYSFGVIAFEMLAGRPPFVGERRAIEYNHLVCRPPSVRETRPIPQDLDELVLACLAKQPEARPQSAEALRAWASRALTSVATLPGVSAAPEPSLGMSTQTVLAWIEGGDPVAVVREITEVHGVVARRHGDGILAAFTAQHHDDPLFSALVACRPLARHRCRIVVHVTRALVRRSAEGKVTIYGDDITNIERWAPRVPFAGLLLTAAIVPLAPDAARPAPDAPGFFREPDRDHSTGTDARGTPPLIGRGNLIHNLTAAAADPLLIEITGPTGAGKSRVLEAVVERVRASSREVVTLRGRRRFEGELPDDDRLIVALGGGTDLEDAVARAGKRGAAIALDDAHRFSSRVRRLLARTDLVVTWIVAGPDSVGAARADDQRVLIQLPPLGYPDAEALLRELLRPARLIPDVLVERLAIRGTGNPALLVALAHDIKRRGAIRRHAGSDEWYVAADELDTLLAPPSPAWFAVRALEELPIELRPIVRLCAGLGPRFCAAEVAAVSQLTGIESRLAWLEREGVMTSHEGWYELADAGVQEAIYDHVLDERQLVHQRAYRYWLDNRHPNVIGGLARLAFHAAGAGEAATAATCAITLARAAYRRGDAEEADKVLARGLASVASSCAGELVEIIRGVQLE